MAILELSGVSYLYGKGTPFEKKALNNVSVAFEEGLTTGIIGHTGSGKSTLVQMLNGLNLPTEGRVLFEGRDIRESKKDLRPLRFKVGLVFQYPEYQLFEETVEQDVAYGPKNMGLPDEEIAGRVRRCLEFTGIPEKLMKKSPFELSGGQKRRVAIAGVMAMHPKVLVLDEPAAGLDPAGRDAILGGVDMWRRETGGTVIIVSHSMEDIAEHCDRILVMNDAEVFAYGTPKEIFSRADEITALGLDVPQINRVCSLLRKKGVPLPADIYTPAEALDALLPLIIEKGGAK
ncbi:MAG: energy-coupling factor transporter ATPase [Clostridia bacterium]|nr:energy-coupling factor transporter ATPase [Clostridia bacterium]